MQNPLRNIPSVHELLESPPLRSLVARANRTAVAAGVRSFLDNLRNEVQAAAAEMKLPTPSELAERIVEWIEHEQEPVLRPVINATGILLHTGLGRAPLAKEALRAVEATAAGYTNLEIDLETGERSQRIQAVRRAILQITGAEDCAVVNNNAAATVLTLAALAQGREVIVSRGQLIEIGGSYRLPEVMSASGAQLREVGTTNKTRIADYAAAITDQTAALLRVHTSNYRVVGFAEETSLAELVALGRQRQLPVIDDIGSGALLDLQPYGLSGEPVAPDSIRAGADLVLFSGDKLVGGPQAGMIAGRRPLIERLHKHPLMRAFRVDKMTLAALAATLHLYQDATTAEQSVPLLSLLATPLANLQNRAERLAPQLAATASVAQAEPLPGETYLGGGSVPAQVLPTWCVAITPRDRSAQQLAKDLRLGNPALMGRVQQDRFWIDLRSVFPSQDSQVVDAFVALDQQTSPNADPSATL